MKCFYHKSDLDGHCSGAIVKKKHPECEMIGVNYNDKLDIDSISDGETVFVVDFSFSVEEMTALDIKAQLFWIDHHKSAIEKMADYPRVISGFREIGKAGCELTWDYLFPAGGLPEAIWLLGRYDVWDHSDPRTLPFQYGMRQHHDTRPESDVWGSYLTEHSALTVAETKATGEIILSYQNAQNTMYAKGMSYEAEFEGHRAIIINRAYSNSQLFDSVYDSEKHDIMIVFGVKPNEYKYSLYSVKPEIDVSELAKKYGGGGHKGAAGFFSETQVV